MTSAYLLVVHGSRDPQYAVALTQLVDDCRHQLPANTPIAAAYLELAESDLATQVTAFAHHTAAQGCRQLRVLPLFLAPGVHASQDVPAALAAATLPTHCQLEILEPIGFNMAAALAVSRSHLPPSTILLVHGSRSPSPFLSELATQLQCHLAYWAIPTTGAASWEECTTTLATFPQVGILLYFLFPGKITTAIYERTNELRLRFPQVQWQITPPLATDSALIHKIVELLQA
jgi:sirohydrochlorin cobaltochelatase